MENDWSKVEPFVSALKDKPSYPLVSDKIGPDGKGWMHERWFKAAGLNAIPAAMVVDSDSRLAWIGDPSALGPVLDKVLAGKWDVTAYRNRLEARQRDEASSQRLLANAYGKLSGATRNGAFKEVLAWIDRGGSSYDGPETQAALRELRELYLKFDQKDFEGALAYAEKEPSNGFLWTYFRPSIMVARIHALQRLGRPWREVATKASETSDPNMLMAIVDALTLPDSKLEPDPRLALDAAQNLARLARAPMFLLRLGWAHYRNGETSQALAIIDEALAQMQEEKRRNPQSHDRLRAALNEAKKHFSGGL